VDNPLEKQYIIYGWNIESHWAREQALAGPGPGVQIF